MESCGVARRDGQSAPPSKLVHARRLGAAALSATMQQPARDTRLVLGIMTSPFSVDLRATCRETWLAEPSTRPFVTSRFVVGGRGAACGKLGALALADEMAQHRDIAVVNTSDCAQWSCSVKVHAWFTLAVQTWPAAVWYGKAEEDGIVWLSALMLELNAIAQSNGLEGGADTGRPWLYGKLAWLGACPHRDRRECPRSLQPPPQKQRGAAHEAALRSSLEKWERIKQRWTSCCGSCFSGTFDASNPREPPRCHPETEGGALFELGRVNVGSAQCPEVRMTPFAVGPLEVRSAALAREVAACDYANRYFEAQATRGRLVETECNGCDGAQGHAIGACVAGTLRVADLGWRRQKYACWGRDTAFGCRPNVLIETINATGTMIVHPVKARLPRARRLELWRLLRSHGPYRPLPLPTWELEFRGGDRRVLAVPRARVLGEARLV